MYINPKLTWNKSSEQIFRTGQRTLNTKETEKEQFCAPAEKTNSWVPTKESTQKHPAFLSQLGDCPHRYYNTQLNIKSKYGNCKSNNTNTKQIQHICLLFYRRTWRKNIRKSYIHTTLKPNLTYKNSQITKPPPLYIRDKVNHAKLLDALRNKYQNAFQIKL